MKESVITCTKAKIWTKNGLTELGKMIRSSREARKLNLRDAAELITQLTGESILFSTLGEVERGVVMPKFNTLSTIASSGIVIDDIGIPLTIYDFIDIASESYIKGAAMDTLIRLIRNELNKSCLTPYQLAEEVGIDFADLCEILEGRTTEDFETDLFMLSGLLDNPQTGTRFDGVEELAKFCNLELKNPAHLNEQDNHNCTNGLC